MRRLVLLVALGPLLLPSAAQPGDKKDDGVSVDKDKRLIKIDAKIANGLLKNPYQLEATFAAAGQGLGDNSDVKIHGVNVGRQLHRNRDGDKRRADSYGELRDHGNGAGLQLVGNHSRPNLARPVG